MIKSMSLPILKFRQIRRLSSRSTWLDCAVSELRPHGKGVLVTHRMGIHSKYALTALTLRLSTEIPSPSFKKESSVLFSPLKPSLYPLFAISGLTLALALGVRGRTSYRGHPTQGSKPSPWKVAGGRDQIDTAREVSESILDCWVGSKHAWECRVR